MDETAGRGHSRRSLRGVAVDAQEKFGTAHEAEAMVSKAVAHIKAVGTAKGYQDFTSKAPGFFDRDLYVVVFDLGGRVLAHGGGFHETVDR